MRPCTPLLKKAISQFHITLTSAILQQCAKRTLSSLKTRTLSCYACQQRPASSIAKTLRSPRRGPVRPVSWSLVTRSRQLSNVAVAPDDVPSFAFAFDIDGVLLRSSVPLPGASKALNYLHDNKIPFILLTNGGGKHESARVLELSEKLGVPLTEENFVQSHTPFKELVDGSNTVRGLKDKTILVTGGEGDKVRKVAEMYGFKNVITPADILIAQPEIWPFNQILSSYYESTSRPLPTPIDLSNPSKSLKIDAIFVFNDPRDWALDSQIIIDLLLSERGILGTYSAKNGDTSLTNDGWQQDGQPKLYFSNPDLFWAAAYHLPRFGQGAFQASLQGVWRKTTGGKRIYKTVIGKPYAATYRYAEKVLNDHRTNVLGKDGKAGAVKKLDRVFMVGDNPESDIRGANDYESVYGTEWTSILVKTGVFQDGTTPKYEPKVIVDDVLAAVKWALEQEGWQNTEERID